MSDTSIRNLPARGDDGRYTLPFREWMGAMQDVAEKEFGFHPWAEFDWSAWADYFEDGYSPRDALTEDMSHA
jgi:hypothetical protein